LWGAGRVEDTYNLLGHALRKALGVIARQQGRGLAEVAAQAGAAVPMVDGTRSLKAALECDWDDPDERALALARVIEALDTVEEYLDLHPKDGEAAAEMGIARRVREQDVKEAPGEVPELIRGVAPERLVSVEDPQMRHGRKSKSVRFCGYKRHILGELDTELVRAVGVTPAKAPEASVSGAIAQDLKSQGAEPLSELHIDRAYLSSELVRDRPQELEV
jgi:hypothetical protein